MARDDAPLTDEERAELEELRAEKALRDQEEQARRERAELARLKAERARSEHEAEEERRIAEVRARNARLMEPDDDLRMPLGQKIVLVAIALVAAAFLAMTIWGR